MVVAEIDPEALKAFFGDHYPKMAKFAELLTTDGITRGLIGPRETERIWSRHLVNCAGVCQVLPHHGTILDLGSGAGLPGIVIAIMRPEQPVILLESLQRRVNWLEEMKQVLDLPNVTVIRGRAGEKFDLPPVATVTARAVAALNKLMIWSAPILQKGGSLYAIKGESAGEEIAEVQKESKKFAKQWDIGHIKTWADAQALITLPGVEPTTVVKVPRLHVSRETRIGAGVPSHG